MLDPTAHVAVIRDLKPLGPSVFAPAASQHEIAVEEAVSLF